MPLKLHYQDQDTNEYAIWQATEPAMYFRNQLQLHPAETEQLQSLNDHKQYEWLASRHLLHILSGRDIRGACLKDEFGKPYLQDSTHHISISHSRDMVAVIASPQACGIDIQYRVEKITRIALRFANDTEIQQTQYHSDPVIGLHILWGAKEALYKAYGRKKLDFKTQIKIDLPKDYAHNIQTSGSVIIDNTKLNFDVFYRILGELVLVYAIQNHP